MVIWMRSVPRGLICLTTWFPVVELLDEVVELLEALGLLEEVCHCVYRLGVLIALSHIPFLFSLLCVWGRNVSLFLAPTTMPSLSRLTPILLEVKISSSVSFFWLWFLIIEKKVISIALKHIHIKMHCRYRVETPNLNVKSYWNVFLRWELRAILNF